jgi:sulfatase modifying factor 1
MPAPARKGAIKCRFSILLWLCAAMAFSSEIKIKTDMEVEEILPFTAVDESLKAVTDLRKPEIVLLVNGMNFRGFSLIPPGEPSLKSNPQAYPELAKAPPGSYYEIAFPYIWDSGQDIRIQLGTNRGGVHVSAPRSIPKRLPASLIEDLKSEVLSLELLRENIWLNSEWDSLNLFPIEGRSGGRKPGSADLYRVRLPASFLKDRIDLFKITFPPNQADVAIQQQETVPASALLQIEKGSETFLLLVNMQKVAALVLKNVPLPSAASPGIPPRMTAEESALAAAVILEKKKKLAALQAEVKLIPVESLLSLPARESAMAAEAPSAVPTAAGSPVTAQALQLADSKAAVLGRLESFRSEMARTAVTHYYGKALKYLRQNQVAKALPFLARSPAVSPAPADNGPSSAQLLDRLRELDRFQRETMARSDSLAAVDLQKRLQKIQSASGRELGKEESAEYLKELRAILERGQQELDFVQTTLAELPRHLKMADEKSVAGTALSAAPSPAAGIPELQRQVVFFLSRSGELAGKTFFPESWTSRVMPQFKQLLARHVLQVEVVERFLSLLPESMDETALRFVTANNHFFSKPFKRSFYGKRLPSLGIAAEWLKDPSFLEVAIQALAMEKNDRGFWEAAFDDDLALIYIPPGSFTMGIPWESGGAEDESPPHGVWLEGYWIARNETTFSQYDRFCEKTSRLLPSDFGKGRKKHPVIGISYQDAAEYCQWLSEKSGVCFRLPTEAEWERAARGDDGRAYPWGNSDPDGRLGNFADANFLEYYRKANPPADESEERQMLQWIAGTADDGYIFTAPVGSFPQGASPCGAQDMAGNVCEWAADWYDGNYYQKSPLQNPPGSYSGIYRVVRGGGWDSNPWMLRSTSRSGAPPIPGKGSESIGFRVAASPLPATRQEEPSELGGLK